MVLALIVFSAIFSIPLTHARGAATSGNAVEALHVARRRTELGAGLVRFFSCMDQPYLDDSSLRTNEFVDWDPNGKLPIHLSASLWEKGKNPAANQVSWMTTSGGPRWEHTCMMLLGRQPAGKNIIWHGSWHDAGAPTMYIDRKDTGLLGHDIATMDITDWQKKTNTLFEVATTHIDSFRGKPYKLEAYRKGMNNAKYVQQWGLNPIPVEGGPSNYPKSMPNDDDLVRFLLANKPAGIENKPPNSDLTVGVTFDDVAALLCPSQKHCEALLQAQGVDILLDKKVPVLLIPDALTDVSRAEVFEGNAEGPALAAVEPASLQDFKVGASSQGPSPAPQSPLPPTPTPAHPHPVGPGVPHQPDATGVWVWESRPWSGLEIGLVVLGALLLVGACVTTVVFFRRASSVGSLPKYQETDSSVPESESGGRSKNWRVCTLIVLIIQVFLGLALVVGVPVFRSQQTEVRSTITPKRSVGSPSLGSPGGKPDSPGPGPQPHTTSHPPAGETPPQQQAADAPTGVSTWPHGFDILRSLLTFNGHGAFSSTKFQIPKNSNVYILAPMGRDPSGQSSKRGFDIPYSLSGAGLRGERKTFEENIYNNSGEISFGHGWTFYGPGDFVNNLSLGTFGDDDAAAGGDGFSCSQMANGTDLQGEPFRPYVKNRMKQCLDKGQKMCVVLTPESKRDEDFPPLRYSGTAHGKLKLCASTTLETVVEEMASRTMIREAEQMGEGESVDLDIQLYDGMQPTSGKNPIVLLPLVCNSGGPGGGRTISIQPAAKDITQAVLAEA